MTDDSQNQMSGRHFRTVLSHSAAQPTTALSGSNNLLASLGCCLLLQLSTSFTREDHAQMMNAKSAVVAITTDLRRLVFLLHITYYYIVVISLSPKWNATAAASKNPLHFTTKMEDLVLNVIVGSV